jgi:hypothetical protein
MAQLSKTPVSGFEQLPKESFDDYRRRTESLLDELLAKATALPKEQVAGRIVSFPIADGYALYLVQKESPLVLQHIPVGDAWAIPREHLRGLRLNDVRRRLWRDDAVAGQR